MLEEKVTEKLEKLKEEYQGIMEEMAKPEVVSDAEKMRQLSKRLAELEEIVTRYERYKKNLEEEKEAKNLLRDPELKPLAEEEIEKLREEREKLETEITELLYPPDPYADRTAIIEIRAATGGEEAALFAADLVRMYLRYAERHGYKAEIIHANTTGLGGYKEAIITVEGKGAYSRLKYESGVHRVQRIPETESGGRIHTSTATVAVLPEAEEVEVELKEEDLEIETFRSSGPGGQHMQKNETAVRIRHIPTGIVVVCQDERSQTQNKERALRTLRAHLLELQRKQQEEELAAQRRAQIGTGARSEKIRTYNFLQNRVTDHRIGLTVHRLDDVLDGDLDEFIEALALAEKAKT
ncbi:peptide chain release factor 1 [bacterium]|nr:peptide chain release factor 1 [bacterium]